jgi:hypothetical protein
MAGRGTALESRFALLFSALVSYLSTLEKAQEFTCASQVFYYDALLR